MNFSDLKLTVYYNCKDINYPVILNKAPIRKNHLEEKFQETQVVGRHNGTYPAPSYDVIQEDPLEGDIQMLVL